MLVLTRKAREGVKIGQDIVVKVLEITGDRVKLGIEAPAAVSIFRTELVEAVRSENLQALSSRASNEAIQRLISGDIKD